MNKNKRTAKNEKTTQTIIREKYKKIGINSFEFKSHLKNFCNFLKKSSKKQGASGLYRLCRYSPDAPVNIHTYTGYYTNLIRNVNA